MSVMTFSLEKSEALPIGKTYDGRDVLAVARCHVGVIVLVREPLSPTGLHWEDCLWYPNDEVAAYAIGLKFAPASA